MQVIITTFEKLANLNLAEMSSLQKTDTLMLFYVKGNETMSFSTHQMLSQTKAKVSFVELQDMKEFPVKAAFIAGEYYQKANKITIIADFAELGSIADKKIIVADGLKKAKQTAGAPKNEKSAPVKRRTATETAVKPSREKISQPAPKKVETPAPAEMSVKEETAPVKKESTVRTPKAAKPLSADQGIDGFKAFMAEFKTPAFDTEKYAMTILAAIKEDVRYNRIPQIETDIAEAMSIYGLKDEALTALKGKGKKIAAAVKALDA